MRCLLQPQVGVILVSVVLQGFGFLDRGGIELVVGIEVAQQSDGVGHAPARHKDTSDPVVDDPFLDRDIAFSLARMNDEVSVAKALAAIGGGGGPQKRGLPIAVASQALFGGGDLLLEGFDGFGLELSRG